ncbi:hypothetical protein [Streptosporangium vulgare]|uniref:Uncharacterized protein n=1 Tax=Streptosporangium vulgare TaxID=46190 RepID=A0ABV5TS15_9ACTN
MPYDSKIHGTYGAYLRGGQPLGGRGPDVITQEPTWHTRDQVHEERREDGSRIQARQDQLGNVVTRETTPGGVERQHVHIILR